MLHSVLLILKIIGLILAILLGIILICLALILLSPIRYKARVHADGNVESMTARLKFSWIFHIVSGFVEFQDKKLSWQIRILGRQIKKKKQGIVKKDAKKQEDVEEKTESVKDEAEDETEVKKENRRKKNFFQKIKYTILNIYDKIKMFIKFKVKLVEFLQNKTHQTAWEVVKEEFFKLLKLLKPKKMIADVEFGFEDPSLTGKVLAGISVLYPFYPDTICITPNFTQQIVDGDARMKGRVGVIPLLKIFRKLFYDKNVRKTYADIKKWKD